MGSKAAVCLFVGFLAIGAADGVATWYAIEELGAHELNDHGMFTAEQIDQFALLAVLVGVGMGASFGILAYAITVRWPFLLPAGFVTLTIYAYLVWQGSVHFLFGTL